LWIYCTEGFQGWSNHTLARSGRDARIYACVDTYCEAPTGQPNQAVASRMSLNQEISSHIANYPYWGIAMREAHALQRERMSHAMQNVIAQTSPHLLSFWSYLSTNINVLTFLILIIHEGRACRQTNYYYQEHSNKIQCSILTVWGLKSVFMKFSFFIFDNDPAIPNFFYF